MENPIDVCYLFKRRQHPRPIGSHQALHRKQGYLDGHHPLGSAETKPVGKYRYMRRDFLQELAHLVMEAEKSYHLLCVSHRPRKASSIIQSKSLEGMVLMLV